MTTLTDETIKKVAGLARIQVDENDIKNLHKDLNNILNLVDQMNAINTENVEPLAHAFEAKQPVRADNITEINQRELFQGVAPCVKAGLYIVPAAIEEEV